MAIVNKFRLAERIKCKASIVIEGLSGSGKTGLALAIAKEFADDWSHVAAIDTESKSMPLYIGSTLHTGEVVGAFYIAYLMGEDGFKPSYYMALRNEAVNSGMSVIVNDSLSHSWQYKGGLLDIVNGYQETAKNKYTAWGTPEVAKEKQYILDLVKSPLIHSINTLRVKEKMEVSTVEGKSTIKSLGEQQIMMPDFKYEPDLVLFMLEAGAADKAPLVRVEKSRYSVFTVNEETRVTKERILQLRKFLEEGTSPEEIEKLQQEEYATAVTDFLDAHPGVRGVWPAFKEKVGAAEVKLEDMTLSQLKAAYKLLTE